ncbi:hypothetical protein GIB67_020607 [Kingdonia uniflora]|uniref:RNase H type-1 domain-containing protein n=1 Tax=Kingdonia uniflora TaxID=39325 RepID=A0A7J7M8S6_9MAGN|nr:hypothetical protein GIB67_020607 [Kingdonia uniflora]
MMKLTWNFLNPKDEWFEFMRAKFIAKSGSFSTCTKGSSIWTGVRGALEDVCSNSSWVIGDGSCINLWRAIWCSPISLKDLINNDNIPWKNLHAKSLLLAGDTMSPYLKDLWIGAIWGGTKLIWHARYKKTFEDLIITLDKEKRKWSKLFHDTAFLSKGRMYSNQSDLGILRSLGVPLHPSKSTLIKSCSWELPRKGKIKINTDGAARGNPGKGGIGCIFRDCKGNVPGTLAKGLGLVTNYTAEYKAIIHGVASAASNGWLIAWVESDSKAVVEAFNSDNIPWNLETEWGNAKKIIK